MKTALRLICCGTAALIAGAAAAESTSVPHPADPSAAVPAPRYDSAFNGYVRQREEKPAPWRDVNDEVARVGGHIGILRGAVQHKPATKGK